jgi:hypothetical protein
VVLALSFCAAVLLAQDQDSADDPSRGVARISVIQGAVNVRRGDAGELVAAALNAPLMTQDHLQTAEGSRAEIQFDAANLVRLAPETDVGLAEVARGRYQLQLGAGTILFRVLRESRANAEIDTPSVSIRPAGQGSFRVTVTPDGTTQVTVRSGTATIYTPAGSQTLREGQTMLVRGSSADPEFQIERAIAFDQFDEWSQNRDQQLLRSRSYQYVSTDIYGAEDLDGYGSWVSSSYGSVWAPRVQPGWAPYQSGRWVWEDYYGWTWVDYASWGWAPFHYGRWFWNGPAGWCWWPGPRVHSYYWRPALVGFFGFSGGGVSVGVGFGNVGWVPLAPYEAWHPWYGRGWYGRGWGSSGYYNRTVINNTIVNNTNIYNVYRNARVNNGVAYTNVNGFGHGSQTFYRTSGAEIRNASLIHGQLPLAPTRASLAFSNANPAPGALRYREAPTRQFFTHSAPLQTQRVPFAEQQRQVAQYEQRTLGRPSAATQPVQGTAPYERGYRQAPSTNSGYANSSFHQMPAPTQGNSGWRRLSDNGASAAPPPGNTGGGPPQRQAPSVRQNRPETRSNGNGSGYSRPASSDSGWHRFGDPGATPAPRSTERSAPQPGNNGAGWHRFGSPEDSGSTSAPFSNRGSGNRGAPSVAQPRGYSRPNGNFGSGSPMRMDRPIVNERPHYSAPRAPQQQRYDAPRNSAPRSNPAPPSVEHRGAPAGQSSRPSGYGGGGHRR